MIGILTTFLKLLVGEALAAMVRAFLINARAERGTDPALLQEIGRAAREAMARTDLDGTGKLLLVGEIVSAWMAEFRRDLLAATSKTMVDTLAHLKLNELWDEAQRKAGVR